jgi:hypothetical protein
MFTPAEVIEAVAVLADRRAQTSAALDRASIVLIGAWESQGEQIAALRARVEQAETGSAPSFLVADRVEAVVSTVELRSLFGWPPFPEPLPPVPGVAFPGLVVGKNAKFLVGQETRYRRGVVVQRSMRAVVVREYSLGDFNGKPSGSVYVINEEYKVEAADNVNE